jgi:tetratricopeptide (TPR) repeat protein
MVTRHEASGDRTGVIDALNLRALIAVVRAGDDPYVHLERASTVATTDNYPYGSAVTSAYLGLALARDDRWDEAPAHLERARAILHDRHRGRAYATAVGYLGRCVFLDGDHDRALRLVQESILVDQASGAAQDVIFGSNALAVIHLAQDDLLAATSALEKSLADASGNVLQRSTSLALAAVAIARLGSPAIAATLFEVGDTMRRRSGYVEMSRFTRVVVDPARATLAASLPPHDLGAAHTSGRGTDDVAAAAFARSLIVAMRD